MKRVLAVCLSLAVVSPSPAAAEALRRGQVLERVGARATTAATTRLPGLPLSPMVVAPGEKTAVSSLPVAFAPEAASTAVSETPALSQVQSLFARDGVVPERLAPAYDKTAAPARAGSAEVPGFIGRSSVRLKRWAARRAAAATVLTLAPTAALAAEGSISDLTTPLAMLVVGGLLGWVVTLWRWNRNRYYWQDRAGALSRSLDEARAQLAARDAGEENAEETSEGASEPAAGLDASTKDLKRRIDKMPSGIAKTRALAEWSRFSRMKEDDSEKLRTYLEWLADMPWGKRSGKTPDLKNARRLLDEGHAGLEDVKLRIEEFIAVRQRSKTNKGAILAFVGPPGVGKTSIAATLASALGRKLVRLPLGGVDDPAELRGHTRTYDDSRPGALIRGIRDAGAFDPVVLLDEGEKSDSRRGSGGVQAALLEILDPQQNAHFRDHYLDVETDLSEIVFVVTINNLDDLHPALRDRVEIVEFKPYTVEQKMEIATAHIAPRVAESFKLSRKDAQLTPAGARRIIEGYTDEPGVRELERMIAKIMRRVVHRSATGRSDEPGKIGPREVDEYLSDDASRAAAPQAKR